VEYTAWRWLEDLREIARRSKMTKIAESVLKKIEKEHSEGITSADLLALLEQQGVPFSEPTLRKWVQLGLLPRSVRVGRKGKHQGSRGKYPVRVVRQILRIKDLMARDVTIEDIQRLYLFVRGELEELEQALEDVFRVLERTVDERGEALSVGARAVQTELARAQSLGRELLDRLERIERRLGAEAEAARQEVAS
jgi:DNA-binding transcriptional MerR regulator